MALHVRDATAEQRVADQYDQLLESIRDGFIAVDREWKIVYVNRNAEVLVSLRRDRARGAGAVGHLSRRAGVPGRRPSAPPWRTASRAT